jgi:rSAM/selenodomain-associated transferase 1
VNQFGVFLKSPQAGRVKTRLGQAIGMEEAAQVYRAFCGDLVETLSGLEATDVWMFYTPEEGLESCRALCSEAASESRTWRWEVQTGADLGARMSAALARMLDYGDRAALIGTDLPTLTVGAVESAFAFLERVPVVLGPSVDGGYYLIGMTDVVPALFEGMPWSTGAVLEESVARLRQLGLSYELLPPERDVDTLEDLADRLRNLATDVSPRTQKACRTLRL